MNAPELVTVVGSIAATLTTAAFVPQVLRVWRLKDARDISFVTFSVFAVGLVGWVAYGALTNSIPVVAANSLTLVLALAILTLKVRFDRATLPHSSGSP